MQKVVFHSYLFRRFYKASFTGTMNGPFNQTYTDKWPNEIVLVSES